MALSAAGLKALMISEMESQGFEPTNSLNGGQSEAFLEALATAIVDHITGNAVTIGEVTGGGSSSGSSTEGVVT